MQDGESISLEVAPTLDCGEAIIPSDSSNNLQYNQFKMETLDDPPDPYDEFDIFADIEMPDAEPS